MLLGLQEQKCPKCLIRAVLAIIKTNWDKIKTVLKVENVVKKWVDVNSELLEYYFDTFKIGIDVIEDKENSGSFNISI